MTQQSIPSFYRVWFTYVDPLTLIPTVYALIYTPEFMLEGLIPPRMAAYNPIEGFFYHQLSALYAFVGIMLGGVLRVTSDVKVWRIIVAGVLLVDISILASVYVSLKRQDRLEMEKWRWQDRGNVLWTGGVAVIRGLFLAGVGAGRKGKTA